MLNKNMLKAKIVEKALTIEGVSAKIGINTATFYRKMKKNSFNIDEIDQIAKALDLDCADATAIFLSQYVA